MDFCSQTDIPALPVSVRRTAPSWQPVSREEPIGKRSDGSPPSWGTRPPNRWEGVEPQCAGGDAQSVKVDSVFPLGEPSLPAPHQPVPLPKVHFLFLKWLANQHAGSSCQLKAGPGADRCAETVLQMFCWGIRFIQDVPHVLPASALQFSSGFRAKTPNSFSNGSCRCSRSSVSRSKFQFSESSRVKM